MPTSYGAHVESADTCADTADLSSNRRASKARQFVIDCLTGGISAATVKTIFAPLDRVKIVLQTQDSNPAVLGGKHARFAGACWLRKWNLTYKLRLMHFSNAHSSLLAHQVDELLPVTGNRTTVTARGDVSATVRMRGVALLWQ